MPGARLTKGKKRLQGTWRHSTIEAFKKINKWPCKISGCCWKTLKCISRIWAVKNTSSIVAFLVNNRRVEGYSQPNLCWSIYLTSVNNMLKLKHSSSIWPFSYFWKSPKGHFIVVKYNSWGAVQCLIDSQGISSPTQNTGVMDESSKADVNWSQIRYIHRLFIFCILSTNL